MKYDGNRIYYTMEDVVDFMDAVKVDGARALNDAAAQNEAMGYAVIGYNSAIRKIRREFENYNDTLMKTFEDNVARSAAEKAEENATEPVVEEEAVSQPETIPQEHTETQAQDIEANQSESTAEPEKSEFAPI